VEVAYTSKPVSGWGGLISIGQFFAATGVRGWLARALPDGRVSNNQVPVADMIMQLFATVLTGGRRFDHVERVREDQVVRRALQAARFGSASSLTRYLGNFFPSQSEHLHTTLSALVFDLLGGVTTSDVLDLDSTVFTRYGDQEGSAKGYNPRRRGARSHHPLLAMFAKSKTIAHAWLRDGSASPHRGCGEFMLELLSRLPAAFRIEAVRADSGFYSKTFMTLLEDHGIPYAIAAKMSAPFLKWCASRADWQRLSADIEITEATYTSPKWRRSRRVIIVREVVRRVSSGVLFNIIDYEYRAIVTSLTDDPAMIVAFYRKRGDCENRIKELKYDFNADGFCLNSFAGTEATFRLICFLFNLIALFKAMILHDTTTTLATIRAKLFVIGALVGSSSRKVILRLGLTGRWRVEFEHLLGRIADWSSSTAAQSNQPTANTELDQPSCWRLRTVPMLRLFAY
jgi:hypothetical protein